MSIRYDENTKARAVRLVCEHRDGDDSKWAALQAISGRSGVTTATLRKWARQAEVYAGEAYRGARNSLTPKPNRQSSAGLIHL
jgi:transposase